MITPPARAGIPSYGARGGLIGPWGGVTGGRVSCPFFFQSSRAQNVAVVKPFFSKSSAARELLPPPFQVKTS
jgi:hypothetical protein